MASLDDLDDDDDVKKKPSLDDLDDDDDGDDGEGDEGEGEGEGEEEEVAWEDDGTKVFAICPPPADWKSGSAAVVIASVAKPIAKKTIEPAGMSYHQMVMKRGGEVKLRDQRVTAADAKSGGPDGGSGSGSGSGGDGASDSKEQKMTITAKHRKFLEDVDNELTDFYGLLGVTPEEVEADDAVVARSFRTLSVLMHPDKADPKKREYAEERFKAIQKAHQTLSDTNRRHTYFSTLDFDDSVPAEKAGLGDKFYAAYRPVFERNAAFSLVRPAPQLGDENTPFEAVNEFYDFWLSFKSFRDFPAEDEKDTANAQDRFEKRAMEKENAKKRAAAKKEEVSRVRRFVEDALRKDPRIAKQKQIEADEKAAKKKAKADARAAEEAKKREAEEEVKRAEAAKKAAEEEAKKSKAAQQQQHKKLKSTFKKLTSKEPLSKLITADDVEAVCLRIELADAVVLVDRISPKSSAIHTPAELESATAAITELVAKQRAYEKAEKDRLAEDAARAKMLERKREEEEKAKKEWSLEEISLLAKAIAKYPGAHPARWGQIATMVNTLGGNRTVKDVMLKSKEDLRAAQKSVASADSFSTYQARAQQKKIKHEIADGDYAAPADVAISAKIGSANKPAAAAPAAAKEEATAPAATATAAAKASPKTPAATPTATVKPVIMPASKLAMPPSSSAAASAAAAAPAASAAATAEAPAEVKVLAPPGAASDWKSEEQFLLEQALRTINKDDPERWEKIAAHVKSKSKKECVARFNEIRAEVLRKKNAAAAAAARTAGKKGK